MTSQLDDQMDLEDQMASAPEIVIPSSLYVDEGNKSVNEEEVYLNNVDPLLKHNYRMLIHDKIDLSVVTIKSEEDIRKILTVANDFSASDVFIQAERPVMIRQYGKMFAITKNLIMPTDLNSYLSFINGSESLSSIRKGIGLDFRYNCSLYDPDAANSGRGFTKEHSYEGDTTVTAIDKDKVLFRCNVSACIDMVGNDSFQITMRLIPSNPPKYSDIGIDESYVKRCIPRIGILYMAGETGSGKSTTLSSYLRYILEEETHIQGNILTLEEPIEFRYNGIQSQHSIIIQSQVPEHYQSFALGVRAAMRRKPALILVGELRDPTSFSAAIELSQTGHPVLSTVHSNDVSSILPRLLELVPEDQRSNKLTEIITTAHVFIAQRLIQTADAKQMAVRETLFFTRSFKTKLLDLAISKSGYAGVVQEIRKIMNNNVEGTDISTPNFEVQAKDLFESGKISNEGYEALLA
ncbi:ATPase, T2SS/T4P/T4SS family [Acinetobacter sp. Marseille-Q1618]|uniref:ATPase, T2SS/T4P/T4SS family n=1 Tax=Acinetobacter sp. Marseille-Q1618 TaxID=2697502 RepID=UPI0020C2ECC3|nr:ATPase, T2SS/T4P/T4SS family [Acinetobacter sp. Marseille-Q1618]